MSMCSNCGKGSLECKCFECSICGERACEHVDELIRHTEEQFSNLQDEYEAVREERDHLLERQDAHLRLIAHMSKESIDEREAKELRGQMATLIAEVGTLRSRIEELERRR